MNWSGREKGAPARSARNIGHTVTNDLYPFLDSQRWSERRAAALMTQRKVDASLIHAHTFPLKDLPTGLRYARARDAWWHQSRHEEPSKPRPQIHDLTAQGEVILSAYWVARAKVNDAVG